MNIYWNKLVMTMAAMVLLLLVSCGGGNPFRSEVVVNIQFDNIEESKRADYGVPEESELNRDQVSHIDSYSAVESTY